MDTAGYARLIDALNEPCDCEMLREGEKKPPQCAEHPLLRWWLTPAGQKRLAQYHERYNQSLLEHRQTRREFVARVLAKRDATRAA